MTTRLYTDRSRYETGQRCNRARWYNYYEGGLGIESVARPLPLCVGGSVHEGLATLLREGIDENIVVDILHGNASARLAALEDRAVAVALADFAQYATVLELPDAERAALAANAPAPESLAAQLIESMQGDATEQRAQDSRDARHDMQEYLYAEQAALVEALVRAYARRRLRPLLEQFEVLEVEREGEWLLSEGGPTDSAERWGTKSEIYFLSRPDALLRERATNLLYVLSYKTTGSWDVRKARDAEHDMQGLSEGIEIERRLAEWWGDIKNWGEVHPHKKGSERVFEYLRGLDSPPRIHAVRMEFLLKGERWKDKELSERFGAEVRSQKSHLIRRYEAVSVPQRGSGGFSIGDHCWSWDYIAEDGRERSLAWQQWKSKPVWGK